MHAYNAFAGLRRDECISQITVCRFFTLQLWEILPQVSRDTAMARVRCSCTLAVNASEGDVLVVCLSAVIEKQRLGVVVNVRLPYPLSKTRCPWSSSSVEKSSSAYQSLRHVCFHIVVGVPHVTPVNIYLPVGKDLVHHSFPNHTTDREAFWGIR